jgi:hypothetical protein
MRSKLTVLVLLALTGCTSTTPSTDARPSASGAIAASSTPTATASPVTAAASRTPPQLLDAQKTFIAAGGQTGPHAFPAISRIQQGTLEVAAICSGSGTIDVKIGSFIGYTVVCGNGGPGELNEAALSEGHENVAVSVAARTTGSWGLSVGWMRGVNRANRTNAPAG